MKTRSLTVTLTVDCEALFARLAKIENLPAWAPGFCAALREEGGLWRAATPFGELFVALAADARTGVIDLFYGVQRDEMTLVPLRVVRQPHGAAVMCTLFQPAGWADEVFELWHETFATALRGLAHGGRGEMHGARAGAETFFPSLVTSRLAETWDFYTTHLGFRTVVECGFYVQLAHPGGAQIGLLEHEQNLPVSELVSGTDGRGFWLNLDVPDADAEYARLAAAGVDVAMAIEDKPWGDRQFVVRDPNGVLIAISHRQATGGRETRPLAAN